MIPSCWTLYIIKISSVPYSYRLLNLKVNGNFIITIKTYKMIMFTYMTNQCTMNNMLNHILLFFTNTFQPPPWLSSGCLIAMRFVYNNSIRMYNKNNVRLNYLWWTSWLQNTHNFTFLLKYSKMGCVLCCLVDV